MTAAQGHVDYDVVIYYDRANGLRFYTEEMRQKFLYEIGQGPQAAAATAAVFKNQQVGGQTPLPKDPQKAFDMVEAILKKERQDSQGKKVHTLFIVDYAESLFPSGSWGQLNSEQSYCIVKLLNWAKDPQISTNANAIILVADSLISMNEAVRSSASRIELVEILLPTPEERQAFIEYVDRTSKEQAQEDGKPIKGLNLEKNFTQSQFAYLTAGLKKLNIDDIRLTAEQLTKPIGPEIVKTRKQELQRQEYGGMLESIDPTWGFECIGGYEYLKDYFRKNVIEPMLRGDIRRCPKGILFCGPSGTGKTAFAKALAKELRMNMVNLDIGKLLGCASQEYI